VIGMALGSLYQRWLDSPLQVPAAVDGSVKTPSPRAISKAVH